MPFRVTLLQVALASTLTGTLIGFTPTSQASQRPSGSDLSVTAPAQLEVDNLQHPLGIDDRAPQFSWQLRDGRRGARQTAYEIQVASNEELLKAGHPDIWNSGKIQSDHSIGLVYKGAALTPSTRYFWRTLAWDSGGNPYPASETSWWETGLLNPQAFTDTTGSNSGSPQVQWVGYQSWYEAAVRQADAQWITTPDGIELGGMKQPEQHIAYRLPVTIEKSVRSAYLFVTGEDVASAWINGQKIAIGAPLPPWKQLPWKKYVQVDATSALKEGINALAVEITHYVVNPNGMATSEAPPMSATLTVQYNDGSIATFASKVGGDCKVSIHPVSGWMTSTMLDSSFKDSISYEQAAGPMSEPLGNPWPTQSIKALRRVFTINKPVASARVYATALGAYELFVNGKRAGDDVLAPGWTDFRERLKYQTYDVTTQLAQGANAIGALLAPGWYSSPLEWFQQPNVFGTAPPSLNARLRIQYTDGSVDWVVTDSSWQASESSILKSEIYDGETQDTRRIQPGWNTASFDADSWHSAEVHTPELSKVQISAQDFQPIRIERMLSARAITEPTPGTYIVDFGQEFSGVEQLRISGAAGDDVKVRTGEVLNADGTLYTENLRTAKSTDHFILNGSGVQVLQPQFTFHGFRYIELTGLSSKPSVDQIQGVVFHTDAPFTAELKTASPMLNQLWGNILWGQRSNFVGVPTDCPQRDERLGWTADAQVFWRAATFNMDLTTFSRKFSADVRGTQLGSGEGPTAGDIFGIFAPGIATTSSQSGAGWSDAGVIIPWTSWMQTGDTKIVEQNWDAMTHYLDAIERTNPDHLWSKNAGISFGDWLSPEGPTRFSLIATAYWAYDVSLMREMAHTLGKADAEAHYAQLFEQIKAAFQKEFVAPDGFVAGADTGASPFGVINNPEARAKGGDTQTGYVLALHMRLVPDSLRPAVAQHLVNKIETNHGLLGTGFLGTPYLLAVLTETGHRDLAYHLLLNTQYPSWGYLVDHGATTMWERWNGDQMRNDPSMNSYNHYAYGAVADWIYRYAAGVDTLAGDPGFHTIYLHPTFDSKLSSIDFTYASPYGAIHSRWKIEGNTADWHLIVPANTTGWLALPESDASRYKISGVFISKSNLVKASQRDGERGYIVPAGTYDFEVTGVQ
ncbi:family 78 glycoside hydrolase catalytic domain [Acidicapsa dinghuensis]|uniref:alpha-L-rhamnosidase n=1 Tax=Acidicapsa dinghuensis TaxID=2218256 RepID=A0ABW1END8_9BACT|nr:alpha-L-rhamnosidase [Acidicapsa dinghuensis]